MLKVTLTTAVPVSKRTAAQFEKAIAKKLGQKGVACQWLVDKEVIGGVKAVIGAKAIDLTVAGKLAEVKKQLLAQL
jgi:F0F1-type ATP synthase delta subunit